MAISNTISAGSLGNIFRLWCDRITDFAFRSEYLSSIVAINYFKGRAGEARSLNELLQRSEPFVFLENSSGSFRGTGRDSTYLCVKRDG